ncbi:MAG: HAMP domain-containing histidine kinase [Alphaproteobacteria bacterium]|nr:HAMP domain-containing histidine kinase [Alphaproteobacteria bacterium]
MLLYADPVLAAHPTHRAFSGALRLRAAKGGDSFTPEWVVLLKSLSARLLILTVFFVMVGEVLIFVPSVARYRMTYFENRLAAGYIAILAFDASPTGQLGQTLIDKLLACVGAQGVALHRADGSVLRLDRADPPRPDFTIDLTHPNVWLAIRGSFRTLSGEGNRILRVLGPAGADTADTAEVLLDEAPLRDELWDFGLRILELSLVLSLVTAALVYLSLQWLLVRPMRRVTASMVEFREDPEDAARVIAASRRRDEIGVAERELAVLQRTVRQALGQRARLAALGTAVTKINHDLRNILATARLVTDGLTASAAPEVRRVASRLLDAIDRAIALCTRTLDFSRDDTPPLARTQFSLAPLIDEIGPDLALSENELAINDEIPSDLMVEADRDQLYRVFLNLARNAVEAGAHRLRFTAEREAGTIVIDVADDGPGLPPKARENLFRPFFGSARPGGSGLGLAIARELVRAHGGELSLASSTGAGTVFRLTLAAPAKRPVSRARASAS